MRTRLTLSMALMICAFYHLGVDVARAEKKVTICHQPPGDPLNLQTITVGEAAATAHLKHGDQIGECPTGCQANSALCDDGNACTSDVCLASGQCGHAVVNCDDGNPCTTDVCQQATGCLNVAADGGSCDDGNACTSGDVCSDAKCQGSSVPGCCTTGADCDDGNACTTDACIDNGCQIDPLDCSVIDKCLAGFCNPANGECETSPVSCDDSNFCTDDSCDPAIGCISQPTTNPEPEICNGLDDDCDGVVDNNLIDVGLPCSSSIGMCEVGITLCCQESEPSPGMCTLSHASENNPNHLVCIGGRGPVVEACNGVDDDCDGAVDEGVSKPCYPFASGTPGVGACLAGVQVCNAAPCGSAPNACCPALDPPIGMGKLCPGVASYGACVGAIGPTAEVCGNNLDDDCDGQVDEGC